LGRKYRGGYECIADSNRFVDAHVSSSY
jgi:hypothetical protein